LKPELHHRMFAHQWLPSQLFFFLNLSWILPFHSKAPTHEIILCRDLSTKLLFFFQSQRQLQLVCLLSVREVTSISSEIQDAYYNTAIFFSNRHPIKAVQLKLPTYLDSVCVPQRFILKKCRQLDGAVAGRSRFNCHCEGLLVEIDKSDFYCLLFCESRWPPSVAVNNIVILCFP